MRILIAEDERRLAGAIARGLRREGMAVDITHDGASALMKARVFPYDVVVLDRDLPELHATRSAAASPARARDKVLMLTAADGLDDVVDGLTLGADDYLPKPFEWKELVARTPRPGAAAPGRARPAGPHPGRPRARTARRSVTRAGQRARPHVPGVRRARGPDVGPSGAGGLARTPAAGCGTSTPTAFTNTGRMTIMTLRRKLGEPAVLERPSWCRATASECHADGPPGA
jgi:CheY-like chemotaxis protein